MFVTQFVSYVESVYESVFKEIKQSRDVSDSVHKELLSIVKEFKSLFVAPDTQ